MHEDALHLSSMAVAHTPRNGRCRSRLRRFLGGKLSRIASACRTNLTRGTAVTTHGNPEKTKPSAACPRGHGYEKRSTASASCRPIEWPHRGAGLGVTPSPTVHRRRAHNTTTWQPYQDFVSFAGEAGQGGDACSTIRGGSGDGANHDEPASSNLRGARRNLE